MDDQQALKNLLTHTWDVFFSRFGRFTDIQAQAIRPILEGKNCVVTSATASGKTEAVVVPLLERLKRNPPQSSSQKSNLSLLYIVPTRALSKDLERRLQLPLQQLGLTMRVKTSDELRFNPTRPPDVLVTTPESFDSLLVHTPKLVKDVQAVVLDELHLYHGTPRGDQLCILLNRLRRIRHFALKQGDTTIKSLQMCALSATLNHPVEVASRFFEHPYLIHVKGNRELDPELVEFYGESTLFDLIERFKLSGIRKALAFCNRRTECESWAQTIRDRCAFGPHVYVHHGSLEAKIRRLVETQFAQTPHALCFATSTLELGIDVGDIDQVLLMGPPEDTQAFLQRIGRGNRRTNRTSVVCLYRSELEKHLFLTFIEAVLTGESESAESFFHPSVVIQQLCSYLKQTRNGEIPLSTAFDLFLSPTGEPFLDRQDFEHIVDHLVERKFFLVSPQTNTLQPDKVWRELFDQRAIYTNLSESTYRAVDVIEINTSRKLGHLERQIPPVGAHFLFAGKQYEAIRLDHQKLFVRPSFEPNEKTVWGQRTAPNQLTPELARSLGKMLGYEIIPTLIPLENNDQSQEMLSDLTESEANWALVHCCGDAYALVLSDVLEQSFNLRVIDSNALYLTLADPLPTDFWPLQRKHLEPYILNRWKQFERWFDLGRFQADLPLEIRQKTVLTAFGVDRFLNWLNPEP